MPLPIQSPKLPIVQKIVQFFQEQIKDLSFNPAYDDVSTNPIANLRSFAYYQESFRIQENGTRGQFIDLYVYLKNLSKPEGTAVFSSLNSRRADYEQGARDVNAEIDWNDTPRGDGSQYLVHYYLRLNWRNWDTLEDHIKQSVLNCYRKLVGICQNSGVDLGLPTRRQNQPEPAPNGGGRTIPQVRDPETGHSMNDEIRQLLESNRQVILFGAPGTGKSFALKSDYEGENASFRDRHARITFYPTYSYSQFVGTYKPVMKQVGDESKIAYEFVPGPLLRMLVKAANDPDKDHNKYLLIIEEINRANAAAVFGDFFQLLDRDSDGRSEYPIAAGRDVVRYLAGTDDDGNPILNDTGRQFFGMDGSSCTLSFPKNLYLHATMNSADQGVFPMDTAFKRRWEFGYVAIDEGQRKCEDENWTIGEKNYRWNAVRKLVNRLLSLRGVNEDKLMGPFFVKPETGGTTVSANQFKSKVLMYLWEDAARMCRRTIFGSNIKTYSELLDAWNASGVNLFEAGDANLGDQGDANARALYRRIVNPTQEIPPLEPPAGVVPEPPESEVVTPGGVAG